MTRYVLDTNGWLKLLTGKVPDIIVDGVSVLGSDAILLIPAAVEAELFSIARQRSWGSKKLNTLTELIDKSIIIHTNEEIVQRYAEIDAFSQGKDSARPLGMSARNMGKNDLWIAATASVAAAVLITGDQDFDHLDGVFVSVKRL